MSTGMQQYDVVVIGAGHNGLTCAAYLGMAGLKVKVVERRGDRRRRGGHRGVLPRLPQLDRGLHRQPAQPEGHQRPAPPRPRAADRRAARPELPARAGRPLPPVGRRPHRARDRQAQPARRRALCRLRPRDRHGGRRPARADPEGAAEPGAWHRRPWRADQGRHARPQAQASAGRRPAHALRPVHPLRGRAPRPAGSRTTW